MTSKNIFSKIKGAFTRNPEEKPSPSPAKSTPTKKSISFGDIISDEMRQFRRRGLTGPRRYQPYTREEILEDCCESSGLFQVFKTIDEISTQPQEDLNERDFAVYFKDSSNPVSKRFYEHYPNTDKTDISSKEVLDLTSGVTESPQERESPLFCIGMFGMYEPEESILEYIYPDLEKEAGLSKELKEWIEKSLTSSVMPDAVCNAPEDYLYFLVNVDKQKLELVEKGEAGEVANKKGQDNQLLYGVSFFKQMPITSAIKEKYPNLSRPHIHKTICVVSKVPIFGRIVEHFGPLVKEYFKNINPEEQTLKEMYNEANTSLKDITIDSNEIQSNAHIKKLVCFLKEKTTTIWKALFLERRVLVYSESPSACSTFIHTLLSLFPCACHFKYSSRTLAFMENHFHEYGLPLQILHDKCLLIPNFGMHHVEEMTTAKGFLAGTSNFLIRTLSKVNWDILIDIDANMIHFRGEPIRKALAPSKLEKDLINGILKKLEKKIPKESVAWNKLEDSVFVDNDDDIEYEGTEEWLRQKFYLFLKELITEIEFFRYSVTSQKLEPTIQLYNTYIAKKGEEAEGRGSFLRLSTKSNTDKDSESERKSQDHLDSASPSPFKGTDQQFFPNEEKKEPTIIPEKVEEEQGQKSLDELQVAVDKQPQMEERKDSRGSLSDVGNLDENPDDPRVVLKKELAPIKNSIKILKDYGIDWLLEWVKTDNFRNWARVNRDLIRARSVNSPSVKEHLWLYENGDFYVGEVANGQRNGNGQFLYRHSRLIYKGEWEKDRKCGNGMLSGLQGTDLVYDGKFKNDKKEGFGRLIQGKERYVGTFVNDHYEGNGVLIDAEQNVYEGEFKEGYKWGMGKLKLQTTGETYVGEMLKDLFNGQGQYIYANGDVYSGGFLEGKKSGYGILQTANGDIFEGQFIEDEFCGVGTQKRSDGHKFEGEFCKGRLVSGKEAVIYYPDGSKYEGFVYDYKPHREGKLIKKGENGEIIVRGRFEDGELVEEFKDETPKTEAVVEEKPVEEKKEEEKKEENVAVEVQEQKEETNIEKEEKEEKQEIEAKEEEERVKEKEKEEEVREAEEANEEKVVEERVDEVILDEKDSEDSGSES